MKTFLIIGGGASGVIMAAQLLRSSVSTNVVLFNESGEIGNGIAYSTRNPSHLLNVRANNMSAFPDAPDHFYRWLQQRQMELNGQQVQPTDYVPRMYYAQYLNDLLAPFSGNEPNRLTMVPEKVVHISGDNQRPKLRTKSEAEYEGDIVILATGNEPIFEQHSAHVSEYWSDQGRTSIPEDTSVAILGTGLSMIDSVLTLLDNGHKAKIYAISRRGLVPQPHETAVPAAVKLDHVPKDLSLSKLVQWFRRTVLPAVIEQGGSWRSGMDALRPHTKSLWQNLSIDDRQRFMRHFRPWWDIHRHRMAPRVADRIQQAKDSGQLEIIAGRLRNIREQDGQIVISYRARHGDVAKLIVGKIIDCRGGRQQFSETRNSVLTGLLEDGYAIPDETDIGPKVSDRLEISGTNTALAGKLYAIGPISRAGFWEVTAIPDIRVQAEQFAQQLVNPTPAK